MAKEKIKLSNFDYRNVSLNDLLNADKKELAKIVFKLSIRLGQIENVCQQDIIKAKRG